MDYYDTTSLIDTLNVIVTAKEQELFNFQLKMDDTIERKVKFNNLFYEIQELKIQIQYYENVLTDTMMNRCCNCKNGGCK